MLDIVYKLICKDSLFATFYNNKSNHLIFALLLQALPRSYHIFSLFNAWHGTSLFPGSNHQTVARQIQSRDYWQGSGYVHVANNQEQLLKLQDTYLRYDTVLPKPNSLLKMYFWQIPIESKWIREQVSGYKGQGIHTNWVWVNCRYDIRIFDVSIYIQHIRHYGGFFWHLLVHNYSNSENNALKR